MEAGTAVELPSGVMGRVAWVNEPRDFGLSYRQAMITVIAPREVGGQLIPYTFACPVTKLRRL